MSAAQMFQLQQGGGRAVITFRDNSFAHPERLVKFIREQGPAARVRPDVKVVFFEDWQKPDARLKGIGDILRELAGIAERKQAA